MRDLPRRDFLRWLGATTAGAAGVGWPWGPVGAATKAPLRVWLVRAPGGGDAGDGARLGAAEGHSSLSLFGRAIDVLELAPGEWAASADTESAPSLVVLALADTDECVPVVRRAAWRGVPVLNAACAADELRRPECHPHLFHVAASEAMRRQALEEAQGRLDGTVTAALWRPELQRFGAAQLNARFRHRWGRDMTSDAWAGWMAVKMGVEACLRAQSGSPDAIRTYLSRAGVAFDGHKGVALTLAPDTRQLRQPLYLVGASRPVTGSASGAPSVVETTMLPREAGPVTAGAPVGADRGPCHTG